MIIDAEFKKHLEHNNANKHLGTEASEICPDVRCVLKLVGVEGAQNQHSVHYQHPPEYVTRDSPPGVEELRLKGAGHRCEVQ